MNIDKVESTGLKIEAVSKYQNQDMRPTPDGEHMWILVGMWKVDPEERGRVHLDLENLLTIEGPGCFKCEQPWSPELAKTRCPG